MSTRFLALIEAQPTGYEIALTDILLETDARLLLD